MNNQLEINSDILKYYVESSNISKELLKSKVANIDKFLDGSKKPTFTQVSKIAKIINIPTGLLVLNKQLDANQSKLNFRTLNSRNLDGMSPELRDTIKEMEVKQDFLKGEIEDKLSFIGKFSMKDNYLNVAEEIRETLEIPTNYYEISKYNPIKYFRNKINSVGIFVFFNGKVKDNTHRSLDVEEFRGFVLSDEKAPIIFVNQKDSKSGQLFTLIHELVHLFIGINEIFNVIETESYHFDPTEAFVNKVTAEILVPERSFSKLDGLTLDELQDIYPVSKFVLIRRQFDLKMITKQEYLHVVKELTDVLDKRTRNTKPGGNYKNNLNFRMDHDFVNYVQNAIKQNKLSYTEAFNIMGVGYKGYKILSGGNINE